MHSLLFILRLCIFDYCIESFVFLLIFFVTLPPSFVKTGPQSDIQVSEISEEQQRKNYLQKVNYTIFVEYSS